MFLAKEFFAFDHNLAKGRAATSAAKLAVEIKFGAHARRPVGLDARVVGTQTSQDPVAEIAGSGPRAIGARSPIVGSQRDPEAVCTLGRIGVHRLRSVFAYKVTPNATPAFSDHTSSSWVNHPIGPASSPRLQLSLTAKSIPPVKCTVGPFFAR